MGILTKERLESIDPKFLNLPKNVHPCFLEICRIGRTGCFFENDLLNNRLVVSVQNSRVLIIPMYWLISVNRANIWERIQIFMANKIPTTKQAFDIHIAKKNWKEYREKIKADVIAKHWYPNDTTLFDIPYSLRIADKF